MPAQVRGRSDKRSGKKLPLIGRAAVFALFEGEREAQHTVLPPSLTPISLVYYFHRYSVPTTGRPHSVPSASKLPPGFQGLDLVSGSGEVPPHLKPYPTGFSLAKGRGPNSPPGRLARAPLGDPKRRPPTARAFPTPVRAPMAKPPPAAYSVLCAHRSSVPRNTEVPARKPDVPLSNSKDTLVYA